MLRTSTTVGLLAVTFLAGHAAGAILQYKTVALRYDPVPGLPGVVFNGFVTDDHPVINDRGEVAFVSRMRDVSGPGFQDAGTAIFVGPAAAPAVRIRSGQPAANTGASFAEFQDVGSFEDAFVLNNAGQLAFSTGLSGTGVDSTNDRAIFIAQPAQLGGVDLVLREGDPVPIPDPDPVYADLIEGSRFQLAFSDGGNVLFRSKLRGNGIVSTNDWAAFIGSENGLAVIAQEGGTAPLPGSPIYSNGSLNTIGTQASNRFQLAGPSEAIFDLRYFDPINVGASGRGIFTGPPGNLTTVVNNGDPAPVTLNGQGPLFLRNATLFAANQSGEVLFFAQVARVSDSVGVSSGLFLESGGTVQPIALERDPAPGVAGLEFFRNWRKLKINAQGEFAFVTDLYEPITGGTTPALYTTLSGSLQPVFVDGDAAPLIPGAEIQFSGGGRLHDYVLNDTGQIAAIINTTAGDALYMTDPHGDLHLIARVGDLFDVDDDPLVSDLKTITSVDFADSSGGDDGRASSFNARGELVFQLSFGLDQGIFVAAIPEPSTASVVAVLGGLVFRRGSRGRRRRTG